MAIYLDNAATTKPDPAVVSEMLPYLSDHFGNPSSIHSFGRESKAAIEKARKKIASILNVSPSEIYFTSGGTEADNTALIGLTLTFDIKTIISTPLEHHAVLHTLDYLKSAYPVEVIMLDINDKGEFDPDQLVSLLEHNPSSLVSIMHGNNEIGNVSDIRQIGEWCRDYGCYFHSDTVQTLGKIPVDLSSISVNTIAGSAHKFHGPKGIGFLYVNGSKKIRPHLHGGGQERNLRSGTENVAGIVGLAKALELATEQMEINTQKISGLKERMIGLLNKNIPGIIFNGNYDDAERNLYSVLNASLPPSDKLDMLIFQLDLKGVAVSGGSACASGALQGSHVLNAMKADPQRPVVRFSFSKFNTPEEIDMAAGILTELLQTV